VQPAHFAIRLSPRTGCGARADRRNPLAHAVSRRDRADAFAPRFIARAPPRLPPTGALRADVAARFARIKRRHFSASHTPHPRAGSSVLLAGHARAHVRVQFAAGPVRNCVLEAPGRFAILNAVEVMPRTPRGTGFAGAERDRLPCRRALRDGVGATRAPPVASCGGDPRAPSRSGTSVSIHVH